ncbi:MAG: YraN family protein [Chamaesiphon sp.]|nr:YraN family protein [Chamaesiphon sp.]
MDTGKTGEEVVAQWLVSRGGRILHQRWRWKRGEIDIIAIASDTLLFIEVKTRNRSNWDADGLLAITPQKQARIVSTAQLFLVKHPHLAELPCRFDVAIVRHQPVSRSLDGTPLHIFTDPTTKQSLLLTGYISGAFDG